MVNSVPDWFLLSLSAMGISRANGLSSVQESFAPRGWQLIAPRYWLTGFSRVPRTGLSPCDGFRFGLFGRLCSNALYQKKIGCPAMRAPATVTIAKRSHHSRVWITFDAIFLRGRHNVRRLRMSPAWELTRRAVPLLVSSRVTVAVVEPDGVSGASNRQESEQRGS